MIQGGRNLRLWLSGMVNPGNGDLYFVNSSNRHTEPWRGLKKPGWRLKPNKAGGLKRNDFTFCSLRIILEYRVLHSPGM